MPGINDTASYKYDEKAEGIIFDIDRFAVHDGPGIRISVFLKGCPLRCQWCHSPESISHKPQLMLHLSKCIYCHTCANVCPRSAQQVENDYHSVSWDLCRSCGTCASACPSQALVMAGWTASVKDVVDIVHRNLVFLKNSRGGVTLTGGEPLLQPNFTLNLLKACQVIGVHTAIETTGFASEAVLGSIASFVDLFLYDIKHMEPKQHRELTGVSNRLIHRNLRTLAALGKDIQVRVPLIPGCNDDDQNIGATCRFAASLGIQKIALLPYNPATGSKYEWIGRPYVLKAEPQSEQKLARLLSLGEGEGLKVQIGG